MDFNTLMALISSAQQPHRIVNAQIEGAGVETPAATAPVVNPIGTPPFYPQGTPIASPAAPAAPTAPVSPHKGGFSTGNILRLLTGMNFGVK